MRKCETGVVYQEVGPSCYRSWNLLVQRQFGKKYYNDSARNT